MGHLSLSFLGGFEATLDDQPIVHFRSAKVQGLLIYLVLTSEQTHSREALAALLWPEEPEQVAKHNLRQSLFRLRKVLGEATSQTPPFLLVNRTTIQFNRAGSYTLDVTGFLTLVEEGHLETAVSHYGGDLLPGFHCDSLPFDEWLRQTREKLHRQALNALFALASQRLREGDFAGAQQVAQQQLALEPWREEAHRQLMQALVLAGERSAALAQYERCRALLAEELGVAPAAETERLVAHIRESARLSTSHGTKREINGRQPFTIPFTGRQAEYKALTMAYQQTELEGVQIVTVVGKAGIGKTRLTEQFLSWAAIKGADVLNGRSFETSTGLSYQPLVNLFRQRLERENAPEDLLSDFWLAQLTRLLPELRDRYPDLPPPTQDETMAKQHLFEAVTRLGQALAVRQPLLLFMDDWHWADPASLDLLHYAVVRWAEADLSILLLLTLRQEAVTPEIQSWLTRLTQRVPATTLHLEALSQQETGQLLQTVLDLEQQEADSKLAQFCEWLFVETEGQPLFLAETLKALAADGLMQPTGAASGWQMDWAALDKQGVRRRALSSVQTVIRGWLDRVSDAARGVLTAVSILEQEASFDHLRHVSGLEELQVIDALDELLGKQLLLEGESTLSAAGLETIYRFSHQKISAVVYAEAGTARQRLLHRRAFIALQGASAPAGECAYHALRAGLVAESVHHSLKAGQEAMSAFATRVALTHYETAWQLVNQSGWSVLFSNAEREVLFLGLGRAYELCEQAEQARDIYEEMVAFAQQNGAASMECRGLNHLARLYNNALLNTDKAFAILRQAWHVAEGTGDRQGMAETAEGLAATSGKIHDKDNEMKHGHQAFELAHELHDPHLMALSSRRLAYVYTSLRRWPLAERYAFEAQQQFEAIGNLMLANEIQRLYGACQMQNGRAREGLETLKSAYAFIQQVENDFEQADVARFLALIHADLGQYGQAIPLIREAVGKMQKVNHPMLLIALSNAQIIYRSAFALDASQEAGLTILEAVANGGFDPFPDLAHAELCAVHALRGEWDAAYRYAKEVQAFHKGGSLPPMGTTSWFETEALLRGGDIDLARAEVERVAKAIGSNRRLRLPLLRSQAVLARWDGDVSQAIVHLEGAMALAQEMGLPGEEWQILGELGKLYAEQGENEKAQSAYGEAAVIIHRLAETIDEGTREGFITAVWRMKR